MNLYERDGKPLSPLVNALKFRSQPLEKFPKKFRVIYLVFRSLNPPPPPKVRSIFPKNIF